MQLRLRNSLAVAHHFSITQDRLAVLHQDVPRVWIDTSNSLYWDVLLAGWSEVDVLLSKDCESSSPELPQHQHWQCFPQLGEQAL